MKPEDQANAYPNQIDWAGAMHAEPTKDQKAIWLAGSVNAAPPIQFSKPLGDQWPDDVKSWKIRPRWLMTFVLWVLRKLGYEVHDLR